MTNLNAQIAAVADQPKVINARNHMDAMNVKRAEAEFAFKAASAAFEEADKLADAAATSFWDAVAEAQPMDEDAFYVIACDDGHDRIGLLGLLDGHDLNDRRRAACIYTGQEEANAKATEMQGYMGGVYRDTPTKVVYTAMTIRQARVVIAKQPNHAKENSDAIAWAFKLRGERA